MEASSSRKAGREVFRKSSLRSPRTSTSNPETSKEGTQSSNSVLPPATSKRLHSLFREVEKEFETLYLENRRLRDKVSRLEKGGQVTDGNEEKEKNADEPDAFEAMLRTFTKKNAFKTRHNKLKAHTSKIVSSFKTPAQAAVLAKEYQGHRDGIWDISVSNLGHPLLGTASADKTARIYGIDSARCLMTYVGHSGSVNAISFHPSQDLALTASGDGTSHIWKVETLVGAGGPSSEESPADSSEEDGKDGTLGIGVRTNIVRQPMITLSGHQNVVIGCQWLDNDLAVTAGWDRVANLYNVQTGAMIQNLIGHDDELTHVACHPTMRMVATSSRDTTFRLWDFRETIHSVSVFQGHTEAVTCAVFSRSDQIISGSDDRSVKVWDLRNMRAPVTNIQTPSAVNRLSVSQTGSIAIPHDNRQVVLYDLSGQKILRLPRNSSKSHHRMVTSTCWASPEFSDSWRSKANLFSAGFDRIAFGWSIKPISRDKEEGFRAKDKSKDITL